MPLSSSTFKESAPVLPPFHVPIRMFRLGEEALNIRQNDLEPCYRILIIGDGEGILHMDEQSHPISRGSLFLSNTEPQLTLECKKQSLLRGIYIEYRCLSMDGPQAYGLKHPAPLHRIPAEILSLAEELESIWRDPQLGGPFRMQQLFIELLREISTELESRQPSSHSWIEQALLYIEANFNKDLTRDQMADLADVSPEHFSRMFRKHTGRTFNAYLTMLRIRCAQKRILTGSPDLNTLAQDVGYKDGFYLSRKFKESVGISPTAYKRQPKRIVALNLNHTAMLLALGIRPELGVYTPWLEQAQNKKNMSIGSNFNPNAYTPAAYYDAVASSHPDVIISYNTAEENKSLLSLAPILELPFKTMSWREQFRMIADTMNMQSIADDWLSQYDELVDRMNNQLDRVLGERGTAVVWEICPRKAYCFSSSYGRGSQILYHDLGFRPPSRLVERHITAHGYLEVDIESIASYPADHIFITSLPSYQDDQQRVNRLFHSQKWCDLEPVRRNRVYLMNQPELFFGYDPISSQAQLHELMKALTTHHKYA